ncbi:MAG: hypothetical protein AAFW95_04985, partial [Cyanobacteria bacterium J06638_6]
FLLSSPNAEAQWVDQSPSLTQALIGRLQSDKDNFLKELVAGVLGTVASLSEDDSLQQTIAAALAEGLNNDNLAVQINSAYALGKVPNRGDIADQELRSILGNVQTDPELREASARALASSNETDLLIEVLQSPSYSDAVKIPVLRGLRGVTEPTQPVVELLINLLQSENAELALEASTALNTMAQNAPEATGPLLLPYLDSLVATLSNEDVISLGNTVDLIAIASDRIAQAQLPRADQAALTRTLVEGLDALNANPSTTDALEQELDRAIRSTQARNSTLERVMAEAVRIGATTLLFHSLFWLALVAIYPTSPQVQAIFFWNPKVRKIFGLGYVELALTWVPWLRAKLFAPFRANLLAEADQGEAGEVAYFAGSDVVQQGGNPRQLLVQAIPDLKGQVVLEGESGLGKTMAVKQLVNRTRHIAVYLPARRCVGGVIEAIQDRLHGPTQDTEFLQSLIYSGAIDICIDGLNEVTPDTRAKISLFAETYFKGNLLIATQPMDWVPPTNATVYVLQPLTAEQIGAFLQSRAPTLPALAPVQGAQYSQACRTFIEGLKPDQLGQELMAQTLSNPMELTLVAQLIAEGKLPDLLNLQQQQYNAMASRYGHIHLNQPFPLLAFAEMAYEMRLADQFTIPAEPWFKELNCMVDYRMVLSRQLNNATGGTVTEWRFRHEKIQDFFIVQTFWGEENERPAKHLGDPRFRGVYLLLAIELPLDQAMQLRELLIDHAVKTKDHTVSDRFIELLKSRSAA